ncbi:MAG: glycoside hydrolase 5 family protein [Thermacetogeniaceae bacterium]
MVDPQEFVLGVNYWPIKKAIYWWKLFDIHEVKEDFQRIAECGLKVVRIFLLWEDFQPEPQAVSAAALHNLVAVADTASECGLYILPTLFCGHMSGANWMPEWMLGKASLRGRFPVVSNGRVQNREILNYYGDEELIQAQRLLCRQVAKALRQHPAVWAYDLGNEASNCVVPPDRHSGRRWLETMAEELRQASEGCLVTFGMHAEDLEEDRRLGPEDAAPFCDFLCMHGYPFYLKWADNPLDAKVLPFLGEITRWLGGKPVLFEEFGLHGLLLAHEKSEEERDELFARYFQEALELLWERGMTGAFIWCYGDYHPTLWDKPPLKDNPHERHFGLFNYDGSPKPVVALIRSWSKQPRHCRRSKPEAATWLEGEKREEFYANPLNNLVNLYQKFKKTIKN